MNEDSSDPGLLPSGAIAEWNMLKYIDRVMNEMMVHVLGLGTPGTGTVPWDDAEDFLEDIVSDFGYLGSTTPFDGTTWSTFMIGKVKLSVPGEVPKTIISAE